MPNSEPPERHILVGTASELRGLLLSLLPRVDLFSFDIFDTLVERRIGPADQVKWLAARHFLHAMRPTLSDVSQSRILELRAEIEQDLRQHSLDAGLDGECRFTEIAQGMSRRFEFECGSRAPAAQFDRALIESELAAETQVLVAKAGMVELLAELKKTGRRVVAISDMYLDSSLTRELLNRVGLGAYLDAVYLSSDFGVGKHSGRLFGKVFEIEGVAAAQVVHIGDNAHSDYEIPLSRGANAVQFQQPGQLDKSDLMGAYKWLACRNPFWCGEHMLADLESPVFDDFYCDYGYRVLGPIFSIFVARLRELLIERDIEKVFFLSREGELFREIYRLFEEPSLGLAPAPPSHYLYVSRKTVLLPASYRGLSPHLLGGIAPWLYYRGLSALGGALGIEPEAFTEVARRLGLASVDAPMRGSRRDWPSELAADAELEHIVRDRAIPARKLLKDYLEQEGVLGARRRIAISDIGWAGTMQRSLVDAFGSEPFWPELCGYYLSFGNAYGYGLREHEAIGVLFDQRRDHFRHGTFNQFEELFENGARALHGSTIGYKYGDDHTVVPVLDEAASATREAERSSDAITMKLKSGALAFAREFVKRHALYGYGAVELVPYAHEVARRAVFYPTQHEVEHLLRMVHVDDAVPNGVLEMSQIRARSPWLAMHPLRLRRLLRDSNWKYGTGRTLGVPGLNHLLRGMQWMIAYRRSFARDAPRGPKTTLPGPKMWESVALRLARGGGLALRRKVRLP